MRLFVFCLSLGLVRVYEIEISHMGKSNGNHDLVCENRNFLHGPICVLSAIIKIVFFFKL